MARQNCLSFNFSKDEWSPVDDRKPPGAAMRAAKCLPKTGHSWIAGAGQLVETMRATLPFWPMGMRDTSDNQPFARAPLRMRREI